MERSATSFRGGALALALAAVIGARSAAAQESGGGEPAAPTSGFDVEDYARGVVARAKEFAEAKDWARALGYLRYARRELAGARYVREHEAEIDEAARAAEDGLGEQIFDAAAKVAEKSPAAAKPQLARLRKDFAGTRFFEREHEKIEALEARVRTALWPGKTSFRGDATLPEEGVVRVAYRFDRIEVLGDFDAGDAAPPRIEGGRLVPGRAGSALRHRLAIPAGATFTAEVEAHGAGKLLLVLEGEGADLAAGALVLEAQAGPRAVKLAFRRGEKAASAEVEEARPAGGEVWKLRVERRGGRLTASTGDGAPLEAEAGAASAFRLGIALDSGKVELERLVLTAPLPADFDSAKAPLPRHVWIPLAQAGREAWKQAATKWSVEDGILRAEPAAGSIVSKELEGRAIDRYEFRAEVFVEARGFAGAEPLFAVILPIGKLRVAWVFDSRETHLDGVDGRSLGMPAPGSWQTISAKIGPQGLEAFLGSQRVLALGTDRLVSPPHYAGVDGLAFLAQSSRRKIQIRDPRIRIE
jgi:hypothetical protein